MSNPEHWDKVYSSRPSDNVGWFTPHLNTSLNWIQELELDPNAAIIDVGGGASTLVDDLLDKNHNDITVVDLSARAIHLAQARLGRRAELATWLQGDITEVRLPARHYRLWHDRAAFHFLIQPEAQRKYKATLLRTLRPDGFVIIGSFSLDAPSQCSGLPVQRYNVETLSKFFGNEFELKRHQYEPHITPAGSEQSYVYCLYQRTA